MLPGRTPGKSINPRTVRRWLARNEDALPWAELAIQKAVETAGRR
jgi:hypothetical protein